MNELHDIWDNMPLDIDPNLGIMKTQFGERSVRQHMLAKPVGNILIQSSSASEHLVDMPLATEFARKNIK